MGIEQLKLVVKDLAICLNTASKIIAKQGLLSLLDLREVGMDLIALDKNQFLSELKDVSDEERAQLEEAFKASLNLVNKQNEMKIEDGVMLLEKIVKYGQGIYGYALRVYSDAQGYYGEGKALLAEIKALVSA